MSTNFFVLIYTASSPDALLQRRLLKHPEWKRHKARPTESLLDRMLYMLIIFADCPYEGDVSITALQEKLRSQKAVLHIEEEVTE